MNPTLIQISKRKRNIFIIVLLFSLAANFFVLGAGISFFMQSQPTGDAEKIKSVERLEKRFLKRINEDDRQAVREVFKQNRQQSTVLFKTYFKERVEVIAYIQGDAIDKTELQIMSDNLLSQERALSLHLNTVLQQLIQVSGQETRVQIADMLRLRDGRPRGGRSWLAPKERLRKHQDNKYE
jgi:uncharacterized membrane protein